MKTHKIFITAMVLGLAFAASEAFAQSGSRNNSLSFLNRANNAANGVFNRPTVSPYLNLLGTDGNATGPARYQTLVRPQLDARRQQLSNSSRFNSLQNDIQRVSTAIGGVNGQQQQQRFPFTTGHPSVYLNGSHYYPQIGR
jgi:hypothetical protein